MFQLTCVSTDDVTRKRVAAFVDAGDRTAGTENIDAELREFIGVGGDITDNPARPAAWLGDRLADVGDGFREGELVMSGGITAALDIEPGDVYWIEFANPGSMELRVG